MPSRACAEITGTGKWVSAAVWNSRSYSMIQIPKRRRPARTVPIQTYMAMLLTRISLPGSNGIRPLFTASGGDNSNPGHVLHIYGVEPGYGLLLSGRLGTRN